MTPAGIFEGEPAKTAPKTAASASATATAAASDLPEQPRARASSTRVEHALLRPDRQRGKSSRPWSALSEREQLDPAAHVEPDARDVGGEVGAEEGDRVRDVIGLARAA